MNFVGPSTCIVKRDAVFKCVGMKQHLWRMVERKIDHYLTKKYRPKFDECTKSVTLSFHHFKIIIFYWFHFSVFTHIKCKKEQPVDFDEDVLSSDYLWDDIITRSESAPGDRFWSTLAPSRDEDIYNSESLLHSHDPLLTSAMVTVGDEAEQVNDLLFDELERITISNPSPSPQLDLGLVSLYLYHYLLFKYILFVFRTLYFFPSSGLFLDSKKSVNSSSNLTPHLNAHFITVQRSFSFSSFSTTCPSSVRDPFASLTLPFRLVLSSPDLWLLPLQWPYYTLFPQDHIP